MKNIFTLLFIAILALSAANTFSQGIFQLWGTTSFGGPDDRGVLFSTKFDGTGQSVKKTFNLIDAGMPGDGNLPVAYNNKLYSILKGGGLQGLGVIIEYDPATNIYTKRADVYELTGDGANSAMVVYGNKLWGTISKGGTTGAGVLFDFNPASGVITVHYNFTTANGAYPENLIVFNNKLYGFTSHGGAIGDGVIFEFDPVGNIYTKKKDLNDETTGRFPEGGFVAYNGKLWTATRDSKGPLTGGYILSYDP
ncbi:MAG: hypothetical protein H7Y27_00685, partial [Gemmatimonadaceae bacterium]|nr:hypothetical protein [Chitinophagaceae bacterium]